MKTFPYEILEPDQGTPTYSPDTSSRPIPETLGASFPATFGIQYYTSSLLISAALRATSRAKDAHVRSDARQLLFNILEVTRGLRVDIGNLPPLRAFNVDDGSILIEWIFTDLRLGFSIGPTPGASEWYLTTTANLGDISASGVINMPDTTQILTFLVRFVLDNA